MKRILTTLFVVIIAFPLSAQTDADALRYSLTSVTGTARYSSMGGAFGALGGDFSSLSSNPAGLGVYRSSEFTFSNSLYLNQNSSEFENNSSSENKFNFNIPNFGLVFTRLTKKDSKDVAGWKAYSFAFGLNRLANFHNRSYYSGFNSGNSMLDRFVESANVNGGLSYDNLDPFYEQLAYDAGLIYQPDSNSNLYSNDLQAGQGIWQKRTATSRGAISEWDFSFGANYNDFLYLGATMGITTLRYKENSKYEEDDKDAIIPVLNRFSFEQDLTTRGTGVNLKIGALIRPAEWLRIGGALHTPTVYEMTDDYSSTMKSNLEGYSLDPAESPKGRFEYSLTTPLKAMLNAGFIIGKHALIAADYEITDFSSARFDAFEASFSDVNEQIQQKYTSASTYRIGGEYRFNNLRFRAGFGQTASPVSGSEKISGYDFSKTTYSAGFGIREAEYFLDIGYVMSRSSEFFRAYSLSYEFVPGAKFTLTSHNIVITLGAKF